MDKSRHHRSSVASRNLPHQLLPQGSKLYHRQQQLPNLSPDSVSCGGGVADKDLLGWTSLKEQSGTPIKKLLADEMSRETESKRRSPGVIARLMGVDSLPLQQPANKQQKVLSENHIQGTAQLEKGRSRGASYDGRSSRRSSKDQQEFKDVFEVSEIPKVESSRYSSQVSADDLKNADAEMSFIEQKFMDAKRLAAYQDLQSSKDFHDTLEILDSNKDLLLKYFKRPDSLFKKHLNDLQASPLHSHFGNVEGMRLSDIEKYERDNNWRSDREKTRLNYDRSHQRHHDGYSCQIDRRHVIHSSPKSSKLQLKGKHQEDAAPTKIVVLKPNLGKVQNSAKIVSSPCSPHNFLSEHGIDTEFSDVRFRDTRLYREKNDYPGTARSLRHNSLESREIAKEITRHMKNSLNNGSVIFSSSRFRGYAGDDSSCSVSENESPGESGGTPATWETSFDLSYRSRRSSHSSESSVSREAKKRLSDRWKIAHNFQEVEIVSKGNTLADMLAISDKAMKGSNFDIRPTGEQFNHKIVGNGEPAGLAEPLGISSRDGWKSGYIGSLSKSRSLPASSTALGSPITIMLPKEALKRERKRGAKSLDQRHRMNTSRTRSGHKKSWSLQSSQLESNEFSPDLSNKMKVNLEDDSPKQDVLATESFGEALRDTRDFPDTVVSVANENVDRSSEPPSDKMLPELSSCVLSKGDNSAADKDSSLLQRLSTGSAVESSVFSQPPVPALESSCCKDSDQPSPVSVLEPSFTDDLSSCSECFESLSADLQGLRMQLQLLKSESEGYVEGPMLISSDEDGGEASTKVPEENRFRRTEDSWESSYIIDVFYAAGIDGTQPDTIFEVWDSLECPISLLVFHELEKRYCDWTVCSRSDRRLVFDSINSGIVKMHKQSMNSMPWVRPAAANIGSKLTGNGLKDDLCKMLASQGGKVNDDALGKALAMESQWLELRDEIDVIGRDIEKLLLEDLVEEIVGALIFCTEQLI